jgi:signal transduction histidine kinase/DNA-binding response OmpR family regulator/HAMP domain-containing protein
MPRLSIARSVRLAVLGLTLALTAVAGVGVAKLYDARQRYEDRLAQAYGLQASAGKLLAAGVVEEATLRTARGRTGRTDRARAAAAFAAAVAQARGLATGDPPSERDVSAAIAAQARLRRHPASLGAPLAARAPVAALAARQRVRVDEARATARRRTRHALEAVIAGGALALLAALVLVATMIGALRRPLDALVGATRRLAGGQLSTRVPEDGPGELRDLGQAFNAMAADLETASERIEAERRRLATTVRSLGDALLIVDADGTIAHANPRAAQLVPELASGTRLDADDGLPALDEALHHEVALDRGGRTLLVTASRLEEDAGVVWTLRDATERVRLERLKSEFVATASHELRSPLTSIKGFVELLSSSKELNDRQREFVEIIQLSTNRLVDLVNDLLDVARVEAGRVEVHRRPTDLADLVREVALLLRPRLDGKDQRLELDLPSTLPRALVDPSRIRQVLTNLLTNAHLYTPEGGHIAVGLRAGERSVALTVTDDGRGMTPEELEHAFDRFYRGAHDGDGGPGTGLGLAIVHSLVELHGGTIEVRSAPGEGTTFEVSLPRAAEADAGQPPAARFVLAGKRVLVVDDEPAIGELIARRLEPYGVETVKVGSGNEALEHLRRERFDAVTLDILMPGMSGFEVLRTLRADPELRALPVVVVSVFSGREALAGEWVVSKPIDADELVDSLGAAVLAGRVRVLVVGRPEVRARLESTLAELGIEHEWVTTAATAARRCQERYFEVALIDAGLPQPETALAALDLRGRRLRRSVVVFSAGDEAPGLARLDADPVPIEDAGATVLGLLQAEPVHE